MVNASKEPAPKGTAPTPPVVAVVAPPPKAPSSTIPPDAAEPPKPPEAATLVQPSEAAAPAKAPETDVPVKPPAAAPAPTPSPEMAVRLQAAEATLRETREWMEALRSQAATTRDVRDLTGRLAAVEEELRTTQGLLAHTRKHFARLEQELDATRSKLDVDDRLPQELVQHRASAEYAELYRKADPLVSIIVATYNRSRLLVERCIPSILGQEYRNLELIIVGDGCTDDTEARVAAIGDPRVRFVNLPQRESYPDDPLLRWMVVGTAAANHALGLARGELVTQIDDDDEYTPDRLRKLVAFLLETRAELVWHPFRREASKDRWEVWPADEFRLTQVTNGSTLNISWFNRLPWDSKTYLYREPGDWNRLRKIKHIGAKLSRFPESLLIHYREHSRDSTPTE